ncbi:thrombopoietin receptor [Ambystoma mexicanum]|uniref:thrombopoietin receptor n=1 Tax=Ambystoma mexicanum TaxID=8296 RepID=UPI0037E9A171
MAFRTPPRWFLVAAAVAVLGVESSPVTDRDVELLREESEDIICFTRTFSDLTCFWDEQGWNESETKYQFFYRFEYNDPQECPLTVEKLGTGSSRYICVFPSTEVQLFTMLTLKVINAATSVMRYTRELYAENVGLIDPPRNICITFTDKPRELNVTWEPPDEENKDFFKYSVRYRPTNSLETTKTKDEETDALSHVLYDLRPGTQYDIVLRTKPNGLSYDGFWGAWSPAFSMVTPYSTDGVRLECFTSDLVRITCEWEMKQASLSPTLYYQYRRDRHWIECGKSSPRLLNKNLSYSCEFLAGNDSQISVVLNVTTPTEDVYTYFKEPFWMFKSVRTPAPQILSSNVSDGQLTLNWETPLTLLEGHMTYEIRYAERGTSDWKILRVHNPVSSASLDLRFGTHYWVQIRAKPNGKLFWGFWSAWSEALPVSLPSFRGWLLLLLGAGLLVLAAGSFVLLRCICPALFSKLKRKVWPPVPNLHRVLDGFLAEIQKQHQPTPSFYEKPSEDILLPCLLEIMSEEKSMSPKYEANEDTLLIKLTNNMVWSPTPVLLDIHQPTDIGDQRHPQQDYVVLAPTSVSCSRYENEYSNGAVAHSLLLLSTPRNDTEPVQTMGDGENGHYATFTKDWPGHKMRNECRPLWVISQPAEREDWKPESINTTDIANQSYLLVAGTSDWQQG